MQTKYNTSCNQIFIRSGTNVAHTIEVCSQLAFSIFRFGKISSTTLLCLIC